MSKFRKRQGALRNLAFFIILSSVTALSFVYIAEFRFNILPCHLCYEQRKPYWLNILLGMLALLINGKAPKASIALLLCAGISFVVNVGISGFHIGVEQDWWHGLEACGGDGATPPSDLTIEELTKYFENRPIVRCDVPGWSLFGISMTGYNFVYSSFLAFRTFHVVLKR